MKALCLCARLFGRMVRRWLIADGYGMMGGWR